MRWRVAESLLRLRDEANDVAPGRSKVSDGTIGDAKHATRTSDHNPYIKDSRGVGVVRALDLTHDPAGGFDAHEAAEHIRQLGKTGDPRVRYVISNGRIASPKQGWAWRTYTGPNAHKKHAHTSVVEAPSGYDSTKPWHLAEGMTGTPLPTGDGMLAYNTTSAACRHLQILLNRAAQDLGGWLSSTGGKPLEIDGVVGPMTVAATVEMLDRGRSQAFANKAQVDLLSDLMPDPQATLKRDGISEPIIAVIATLAAVR